MNRWGIPKDLEDEVRKRDKFCVYCGIKMVARTKTGESRRALATWEHIVNDASNVTRENIALCCAPCNSSKGTKSVHVWIQSDYCARNRITPESVAPVIQAALRSADSG